MFQKTLALNDWYRRPDDWEYPLGGIQMLGKSDAEQIRGEAPRWAGWAATACRSRRSRTTPSTSGSAGEDLPLPDNRVTLDGDGKIHLALQRDNNIEGLKRLRTDLQGMLGMLGMHRQHLLRAQPLPAQGDARSAPPRTRRARSASAPTRAPRPWT